MEQRRYSTESFPMTKSEKRSFLLLRREAKSWPIAVLAAAAARKKRDGAKIQCGTPVGNLAGATTLHYSTEISSEKLTYIPGMGVSEVLGRVSNFSVVTVTPFWSGSESAGSYSYSLLQLQRVLLSQQDRRRRRRRRRRSR